METEPLSTRALAAYTLDRVLRGGAYSNVLVAQIHVGHGVDRSLYQRLVYEALRQLEGIDEAITRATDRKLGRIQPEVLAVLRIGTAELRYLHRASHSAVSEAVDAVRQLGRPKASGFVNGVLRSVDRTIDEPVSADDRSGYPQWLYERLVSAFGDNADAFMAASNEPGDTGIRSRDGVERGKESGVPGARYITHDDSIAGLVDGGLIDVIDPASVAVVNALSVRPGDNVADLAAAPGGKTRAIADAAGPGGFVVACDIHIRRLATARKRSSAFGQVRWVIADAAAPPLAPASFDRVLLDAPCTGMGTLRRRPEIRHRIDEDAPGRFGALQRSMLTTALDLVAPGGRLVYSVCTVLPEETTDVVSGLGGRPPHDIGGMVLGDGKLLAPHITGTDGMFITVFDR